MRHLAKVHGSAGNTMINKNGVPKVTVCVVTFNQEAYISKCLQGIVDQKVTYDFEILVGDDCSSDGTWSIISEFAKAYPNLFHVFRQIVNVGPYKNLVDVHAMAKGQYVCHCDGDDYWLPGKLQYQSELLDRDASISAVFTNARRISNSAEISRRNSFHGGIEGLLKVVFTRNILVHSSVMERRANSKLVNMVGQEYDFELYWIKHGNGSIQYSGETFVMYNDLSSGISRTSDVIARFEKYRHGIERLLARGLPVDVHRAMMANWAVERYLAAPSDVKKPTIKELVFGCADWLTLAKVVVPRRTYVKFRRK